MFFYDFQARHTTYGIRKCFLFLLQCQLSLVIIQVGGRLNLYPGHNVLAEPVYGEKRLQFDGVSPS